MSGDGQPLDARRRRAALVRKIRPYARVVLALVAIGLVAWVLSDHSAELAGAGDYLRHASPPWIAVAVISELGSIVAYSIVQQRLLEAGRVHVSVGWITGVTLANIAITDSLPTGSIVATIFLYRQYRRRGADEVLAAWALAALLVVTSVTLALVAAAGVGIAGSESSDLDLVGVTIGILALTLVVAALFVQRRALVWLLRKAVRLMVVIQPRFGGRVDAITKRALGRLTSVTPTPLQMVSSVTWGLFNWVLDCGCLVLSFAALGVGVPWRGLLLAYGAGQLAANLPITPGGLGVVEGSITVALVAYGGAETSTVAAVFLYRLISFWGELPVGWIAWAWLARISRRERPAPRVAIPSTDPGAELADPQQVAAK